MRLWTIICCDVRMIIIIFSFKVILFHMGKLGWIPAEGWQEW
jgi:hypothetical protein